jgi:hypothetical protein
MFGFFSIFQLIWLPLFLLGLFPLLLTLHTVLLHFWGGHWFATTHGHIFGFANNRMFRIFSTGQENYEDS